jgi:hypothetical protein
MASLVLTGDTSGQVTIAAPAVAGTTTLTLPATSGTVLNDATVGVCRAWVNFNGTGTPAIRASFNVSSITDNGTGDYTVNFTTAMTDVNYSPYLISSSNGSAYIGNPCLFVNNATNAIVAPTTSAYRISFRDSANGSLDPTYVCTGVFR